MATGIRPLDLLSFLPDPSDPPELGFFGTSERPYWAFDGSATTEKGVWVFSMPSDYASALVAKIMWCASSSTTGTHTCQWNAYVMASTPETDAVAIDTDSYDTINSIADDVLGSPAKRPHLATLTITNADSVAAGDYVALQLSRDPTIGVDDLGEDAWLLGIYLEYTTT